MCLEWDWNNLHKKKNTTRTRSVFQRLNKDDSFHDIYLCSQLFGEIKIAWVTS